MTFHRLIDGEKVLVNFSSWLTAHVFGASNSEEHTRDYASDLVLRNMAICEIALFAKTASSSSTGVIRAISSQKIITSNDKIP